MRTALGLVAPASFALAAVAAWLAPAQLRRRQVVLGRVVAAAAAGGVALASTEPTGVAVADALLGPVLAIGVTLLAARANPWTVAGTAGAVALASVRSPHPEVAFIAAGAALALALTAHHTPLPTSIVGAGLVNAAVRLRLPGPAAVELAVATALLVPVVLSGYLHLQGRSRRRFNTAAFGAAAAVGPVLLLGLVALAASRPSLERAVDAAGQGLDAARAADQTGASQSLDEALDSFGRARQSLDAWWARPARLLPLVGPHLRALHVVASTGADLTDAGRQLAVATDLGGLRIQGGRVPLDRIDILEQPLGQAGKEVERALVRLRRARSRWLVPPVTHRLDASLDRLSEARQSLQVSEDVVGVLPELLGSDRPRRWFLAVQTPAESRGSGGFIGNYGEITAEKGSLQLARFGRIGELNGAGDPANRVLEGPPDLLHRYRRFDVEVTWQNVNLSPDFPSVAKVIAGLYPQSGGQAVDGVVAVDPTAVASLLRLTGPLSVPPWPVPLTAKNAERVLLHEQYAQLPLPERIDFLGEVTRLLWNRLTTGPLPPVPEVLKALGPAVAGKHVMVSAVEPSEDAVLARAGVNGRLAPPAGGDALAVVTQNGNGNKIDWYLRRRIDYRASHDEATGRVQSRLAITLDNGAPPTGAPEYVVASLLDPPLPAGTNRLYLSVYSPLHLLGARVDGAEIGMESEVEAGRRVYSAFVDIPAKGQVVVELELAGRLAPGPYRLGVHAQPLVSPDRFSVALGGGPQRRVVLRRDATFLLHRVS